jgi:hypothetical protein
MEQGEALQDKLKALDGRLTLIERLVARLTPVAGEQKPKRRKQTVRQAILQVMTDNRRSLSTLEIEIMAGRLLGRPLSKQSVSRYLAGAVVQRGRRSRKRRV